MIQPRSLINGRYRVGRRLGDGGMAIVYLGHDLLLGRDVAIKTLRPQYAADPAFRTRFEREARAAASLSHPNIIDVHDVGDEESTPFIVMELVRGQTLREIIAADAPFHPDDVAELLEQIGGALDYAHARGYVHRDVKPGNILVDEHGRARIVDFGIAKGLADADLTEMGSGLGTVGYLSPEQAEGLMATPASDVYSAGVVAFEMLTGELPFRAETPVGLAMRHIHEPAPPPSSRMPGIAPRVDAVVLRALDKDPTRRWRSVSAFSRAMRDWRKAAPRPSPVIEPAANPPATGSLVPTIVIVLIVLGALAALLWTGFRGLPGTASNTPPTVLVAPPPAITGGLDQDDTAIVEPTPETRQIQVIVPQEPTVAPVVPTIAPVSQDRDSDAETSVTVPNLVGLTISGASQALGPLDLRIVPGQPIFSESIPMNAVAEQDPPAGSMVAPGERVRVSLSRGPSPFADGNQP